MKLKNIIIFIGIIVIGWFITLTINKKILYRNKDIVIECEKACMFINASDNYYKCCTDCYEWESRK